MNSENRVVITGIGPLTSIGIGKEALWKSLIKEQTGLVYKDYFDNNKKIDSFYTYEIKDFNIESFGIEKAFLDDIRVWKAEKEWLDLKYILAVTKLALDDTKLTYDCNDNKIGLVLAHENPGLDEFYIDIFHELLGFSQRNNNGLGQNDYFQKFFKKFERQAYDLQSFMLLYHVAKTFGIHGYSLFVNNACASGLYAIEAASDIIKSKKCDAVIVAAADRVSIFKQLWFKELGMYPKDGKTKPFAKDRNGFVLGDAAAGVVLESLDSAKKRKAHIYAEYLGGGFSLEGWKVSVPNFISDSFKKTIGEALDRSKIDREQIDLIIPHGVGTSITDNYEAKAITDIFGRNFKRPFITAVKPYIGHNLGCSALIETIILLLCLENNLITPTLFTQIIDDKLNIQLVTQSKKANLKMALKTVCAFAGYNAAGVFRKI